MSRVVPDRSVPPEGEKFASRQSSREPPTLDYSGYPVIYITNALPYIVMLEHGLYKNPGQPHLTKFRGRYVERVRTTPEGFSIQAPKGMVRVSLVEEKQFIDKFMRSRLA